MSKSVGVDWGGNGWIAVVQEDGEWSAEFLPSMLSLWLAHGDADRILIDIPIGLPGADRRACDEEAKDALGARRRSVFYTPCRDAVYADSYEAAKEANEAARGDGLSTQAWSIAPRIREVDEFLREYDGALGTVRESHPEVCFARLGDGPMDAAKADREGYESRVAVFDHCDADIPSEADLSDTFEKMVAEQIESREPHERRIGETNRDDLVDAFALAMVASLDESALATFPEDPPEDDEDHPMEIVYPDL